MMMVKTQNKKNTVYKKAILLSCFISLMGAGLTLVLGCGQSGPMALSPVQQRDILKTFQSQDYYVAELFKEGQSNVFVEIEGQVIRKLPDDIEGSRHQRFIIELKTGQTLLVSHNIDLAPRIDDLDIGHIVHLRGEYEWNPKGGVVHYTHHDPGYKKSGGWLIHNGYRYE